MREFTETSSSITLLALTGNGGEIMPLLEKVLSH